MLRAARASARISGCAGHRRHEAALRCEMRRPELDDDLRKSSVFCQCSAKSPAQASASRRSATFSVSTIVHQLGEFGRERAACAGVFAAPAALSGVAGCGHRLPPAQHELHQRQACVRATLIAGGRSSTPAPSSSGRRGPRAASDPRRLRRSAGSAAAAARVRPPTARKASCNARAARRVGSRSVMSGSEGDRAACRRARQIALEDGARQTRRGTARRAAR